eukprot:scaffold1085_cov407-Prasinococcus_capsulatus_cf.AAC.35
MFPSTSTPGSETQWFSAVLPTSTQLDSSPMTYGYEGTTALGASDQIRPCCRSTLPSKPTTMPMLSLAKSTPRTFGSGTILARPLFPRAIISLRVPVAVFSNRYSRFIPRQIPLLEVHSMTRGVSGTGTSCGHGTRHCPAISM